MYSLFVSGEVEKELQTTYRVHRSRYLEHTTTTIRAQFWPITIEAGDCLKAWPCILMCEGRAEEIAHLVQIANIVSTGDSIKFNVTPLPGSPKVLNADIWKARVELDIEQFEFNRNHFAIKERDLLAILTGSGYAITEAMTSRFANHPLPSLSRSVLMSTIDTLASWSHDDLDGLIIEAGSAGFEAARALGSRKRRAQVIIKFALDNPSAVTADNHLLSAFVVGRAMLSSSRSESPSDVASNESSFHEPMKIGAAAENGRSSNRVFIVHGQNDSARNEVVSFLTSVGLQGIVLHEQANMGRHLLTKFIDEADLVTFAIVLMTDDDVGGAKGAKLNARARQNVILELGYFLSHLGQQNVCAIKSPGLEAPSDFDGIVYISMDDGGKWKVELKRELEAAGMPVNEPSHG